MRPLPQHAEDLTAEDVHAIDVELRALALPTPDARRQAHREACAIITGLLAESTQPAEDATRLLLYIAGPAERLLGTLREAVLVLRAARARVEAGA